MRSLVAWIGAMGAAFLSSGAASAAAAGTTAASPATAVLAPDPSTFGGLRARALGTARTSGRISALDADGRSPLTIYVGAASGGVWRSTNGGHSFKPVFDEHNQSIGAIRIDPTDPQTVWVGTGESWVRNSVSAGDGVYRSSDGGNSWTHLGLRGSERIAEILVSPHDPDTVLVCVTGALWHDSSERGVYRSRDAGQHWERVLHVDARTGCSDLAMDPANPNVLYAGMWSFRRSPDFFQSGGPGSGLYRSFDGGDNWVELKDGLPAGEKGRISLAVAPSRPNVVYAIVEAERTALYRSDDMGKRWEERNASTNVAVRPFYFGELKVDPKDAERVWRPGLFTTLSIDGGKTFSNLGFGVGPHPDHHALWIDPVDPQHLLLGTDGGLAISHDGGSSWSTTRNLPISQFYHVSADLQQPYHVYGGLQDNGSWSAPSRTVNGVRNEHWQSVGYGDGFWAWADPQVPQIVYSEYQGGKLLRLDRRTSELKSIEIARAEGQEELRFNWNTPLVLTPSGRLLAGSQYLHASTDRGESWRTVSPDLTSDDPKLQRQRQSGGLSRDNSSAENHTTIYTIAESPLDPRQVWVGTDDGRLHLTRDDGASWNDLSSRLAGVPRGAWISRVEASPHDAGSAFVTVDDHRRGDFATYLLATRDFGRSWQRLPTDGVDGWAWVVKQDPLQPGLLYLGTETGLFISLDGGASWTRFRENLPKVAVHDLVIHPREHDLVIATHGRGVYIIDDLTPLRALTPELLAQDVALLPSRPAVQVLGTALQEFGGGDEFVGANPADAAIIAFHQRSRHLFGDLKVNVYDAAGALLASLPADKRRGMVRVEWPMRLKPPRLPASTQLVPAFVGPRMPEGEYRIELVKGKTRLEGRVQLQADPRSPHTAEDRAAQQQLALALYRDLGELTFLAETLAGLRDQAQAAAAGQDGSLGKRLRAWADELEALRRQLAASSNEGYVAGDEQLREYYGQLYGAVVTYDGRPSQSQLQRHRLLQAELAAHRATAERLLTRVDPLNAELEKAGGQPLQRLDRAQWEARDGGSGSGGALQFDALRLGWQLY